MKETRILMGMPITVCILDKNATKKIIQEIFDYFSYIEGKFSVYKKSSEISKINDGKIKKKDYSEDMKLIFKLSEQTKKETRGYFDIFHNGKYDTSGLVKGWAIYKAAEMLKGHGFKDFFVDAGGDIQVSGKNKEGEKWKIGIRNPFNRFENVKVLFIEDKGVATSGTYIRGQHIYNPHDKNKKISDIVSLTVIGPDIYEAKRFATAAFAMGREGIEFIKNLPGFEGYLIDKDGVATFTDGLEKYLC
jgi:FAD:protein FMN transferase